MTEFLLGKDYPRLCEPCRAAVDEAAFLLKALGPDTEEDPEAPLLQAGDLKLLCGGCYCKAAERPQSAVEGEFVAQAVEILSWFGSQTLLWKKKFQNREEAMAAAEKAAKEKAKDVGTVVLALGDEEGFFVIGEDLFVFEVWKAT